MTTQSIKALFEPILKNPVPHKSLYFNYLHTLLDFLKTKVFNSIEHKKSIVITLSDEKLIPKLEQELADYKNYLMVAAASNPISKENIGKLRLRSKIPDSYPNYIEYTLQHQTIERSFSSLIQQFDIICSNPLYKKYSLNAPTSNVFYLNLPILSYHIDKELFSFKEGEIECLNSFISNLTLLYRPQYSLYTDIKPYTSKSLLAEPQSFVQILQEQLTQGRELIRIFSYQLNDYADSHKNSIRKKHISLDGLITELNTIEEKNKLLSSVTEKQTNKGIFRVNTITKRKTKYKQFQENIYVQFESWRQKLKVEHPELFELFHFKEEKTLEPNIDIAKRILLNANNTLTSNQQIEEPAIDQLNLHNCPEVFKSLINDIDQFYHHINDSQTLIIERDVSSFNLMNEYNHLTTITNKLSQIEALILNYPEYIQWLSLTSDLNDLENSILICFTERLNNVNDWQVVFEEYYYHLFITNKLHDLQRLSTEIENLNELDSQLNIHLSGYINHLLNDDSTSDLSLMQTNNKELYKLLFKKKYDESNFEENSIKLSDRSFFSLFPITIMSRQAWNAMPIVNKVWDEHIYIDTDKFEKDVKHGIGDENFYHLKFPIDEYQFDKKLLIEGSYHIIEDTKEYLVHPKLRTDQDLLSFARSLSSKLERYQHCLRIFQINKRFIICFLNDDITKVFKSLYHKHGIKEFKIDQDLNYSLSDILLQEPEKISFLTQDLLLDPENITSLKWQYYLLDLMRRSGMEWHNISSYGILEYGLESILEQMNLGSQEESMLTNNKRELVEQ